MDTHENDRPRDGQEDQRDTTSATGGTPEPGGLGEEGTIPAEPDGVAAGYTGEKSTFEPEEDEQA